MSAMSTVHLHRAPQPAPRGAPPAYQDAAPSASSSHILRRCRCDTKEARRTIRLEARYLPATKLSRASTKVCVAPAMFLSTRNVAPSVSLVVFPTLLSF